MVRGEAEQIKVHYKGQEDDFIVLAETSSAVQKWREDKSTPLVDVVSSFDVFVTGKHGTQGTLNRASNGVLENEFGTSNEDDVVKKILEDGTVQEQKVCRLPAVSLDWGPGLT
jgi:ribosome maturation protein Sdo1